MRRAPFTKKQNYIIFMLFTRREYLILNTATYYEERSFSEYRRGIAHFHPFDVFSVFFSLNRRTLRVLLHIYVFNFLSF